MNGQRIDVKQALEIESQFLILLQDRLRAAVADVSRLQQQIAAQSLIVQSLCADVERGREAA